MPRTTKADNVNRINKLEQQYQQILSSLPELFRQTEDTLKALQPTGVSCVIVRNYTTYSAYEDPIGE